MDVLALRAPGSTPRVACSHTEEVTVSGWPRDGGQMESGEVRADIARCHARRHHAEPAWSASFPTSPPSSASSAPSWPTCTTNGRSATAATYLKAPWPNSNRPAIMRQSPQSRLATRHRESLESPPPHEAQSDFLLRIATITAPSECLPMLEFRTFDGSHHRTPSLQCCIFRSVQNLSAVCRRRCPVCRSAVRGAAAATPCACVRL